ncbi:DUF2974 domain-containing protein [Bifidobacterium leontopitheci]|uniref:Alpha/beta hydrolase n=1 Tax=Bifidobacterium leontopitheci TaxID=2650774 RepID=A0A6I1GP51_9BIFI|nr:DUF2974 domain-containing protein [Bifidobacterium leontopitheci]KAB7789838.1 hypothetical protein F7D09_1630 [Bifidobacterium leontopitheci]
MANIIDYAHAETRPFSRLPFNAVDALVFASLVYKRPATTDPPTMSIALSRYGTLSGRLSTFDMRHPLASLRRLPHAPFSGTTLAEAASDMRYGRPRGFDDPALTRALFEAVAANPRFAGVRVDGYADYLNMVEQSQFAAVTALLPDGTLVVAFRGTDDSLVSWKEDFNMAFRYPVPAQRAACEYVCDAARLWGGPIILTGHSKGGNLAVYAAMNAPAAVRRRIRRVYSLDGPGFPDEVVHGARYRAVVDRIVKIVPDSSIVGMIFETPEPLHVVRSDQKGVLQHMTFSWQVEGDDFVYLPDVSTGSRLFSQSLNRWIAGMSTQQRERTVDALFAILRSTNADTLSGVMKAGWLALPGMAVTYLGLSGEDRRHLAEAWTLLRNAERARTPARAAGGGVGDDGGDGGDVARGGTGGDADVAGGDAGDTGVDIGV